MRLFIECLPYVGGLLIGLYQSSRVSPPLPVWRLLGLCLLVGLFVNRLSGEAFPLVLVDTGVVVATALVAYYGRRGLSGY
ncbi:hypothetical protein [uncultured Fibrella sp.]|uniref:hypothetical protein n=1 Tax=uncultured Fibrella sp. TaxID=1284596 RepID=UPI0035CC48BB